MDYTYLHTAHGSETHSWTSLKFKRKHIFKLQLHGLQGFWKRKNKGQEENKGISLLNHYMNPYLDDYPICFDENITAVNCVLNYMREGGKIMYSFFSSSSLHHRVCSVTRYSCCSNQTHTTAQCSETVHYLWHNKDKIQMQHWSQTGKRPGSGLKVCVTVNNQWYVCYSPEFPHLFKHLAWTCVLLYCLLPL